MPVVNKNDTILVDNLQIGSPAYVMERNVYAGNMVGINGPMKWSGTHFEPATAVQQKEILDALDSAGIPASPKDDNIGGGSRRMVVGDTWNVAIEKDAVIGVD
jgi:hypothetical protein